MKKFTVLLLLFSSYVHFLHAQSAELGNAYQNKVNFTNSKDYDQAVVWGEKTIALAEKEFGKTTAQFANYATDLASLYQLKNDLENAEKWYMSAYKIYLGTYGEVHAYTSVTAFNLAIVYESRKKNDMSELYYLKALGGYEKSLGRGHDYYKMALTYLIKFYEKTLQYEKQEKYLLIDLETIEKKAGKNDEYAAALVNLGLNYFNLQNYKAAETRFLEALKLLESLSKNESDDYYNACGFVYQLYEKTGEFEKAISYMKIYAAYIEKTKGKDSKEYAIILSYEGEVYRNVTMYGEAEKCFSQALFIIEKTEGTNNAGYATLLNNLGYLYKLSGQYEKSEKYLFKSLVENEKLNGKETLDYAVVLNNLGLLKTGQGKYESAEAYYLEAILIQKKKQSNTDTYGSTLNNLGLLYSYMGKYSRALDLLEEAKEVKAKTIGSNHPEYANTIVNIANIHSDKGNYVEAEKLYKESQLIYKNTVGITDLKYANGLTNLGQLYYLMGQYDKALELHLLALNIKEKALGIEHPEYAISLNFIGICYLNDGQLDLAEKLFNESLVLKKKILGLEHPDVIIGISNLALVQLKKGNSQKAASMLEECVALGKKNFGDDNLTYATYLNNLGSVYLMQRNYSKAGVLFLQAKNIREKYLNKNHVHLAEVNSNLAYVFVGMGDLAKAEPHFLLANEVYYSNIRNQFPFMSEKDKEAFFLNFQGYINNFYAFCINRSIENPMILERMYNNQLNFKALLLNETKQLRKHVQEDRSMKDLYNKWINQREYLAKVYSLDITEIRKRNIDLAKEEEKVNELEKEFAGKSDFFARSAGLKTITWKDVYQSIQEGEAAIEVINITSNSSDSSVKSTYAALIVSSGTKNYPRLVLLDRENENEEKYYAYFINSIKLKKEDNYSYNRYWSLLKEALDKEGTISKVYLSADGIYNKLSLNALMNPSTKAYLCDEVDVHLISNTKLLVGKKVVKESLKFKKCELYGFPDYASSDILPSDNLMIEVSSRNVADTLSRFFKGGVIPDLPGTEKEVQEISKIFKLNGIEPKVYLRKKATEERLKSTQAPDVLHIATHGFFLKDESLSSKDENMSEFALLNLKQNPLLRSGLLLAGVSQSFIKSNNTNRLLNEDGVFTAYEAMNLDLRNTKLVVLSACETGLGEIKNGEGVYGLQRALEISGAEAILMSLWTVNDVATQELMILFYKEWMESGNKRASFNKARQKLREKYKDPYYWAAFVFIGE